LRIAGVAIGCPSPNGPDAKAFHAAGLRMLSAVFLRLARSATAFDQFGARRHVAGDVHIGDGGHPESRERVRPFPYECGIRPAMRGQVIVQTWPSAVGLVQRRRRAR
jgi:hypothetical protein